MSPEPLRILAIGAHPPDIIARAGGTLAKHARRGDIVMAAALTDGVRHMNSLLAEHRVVGPAAIAAVAQQKRAEMQAAAQALGIQHVRFLGLRESPLVPHLEALHAVTDLIREFRPDVIFCHHPQETILSGHPDHGPAGELALSAYMLAMELGFESRLPPWVVNNVYLFDSNSQDMEGPGLGHLPRATVYVDITEVIEAKRQALLALGPAMGYTPDSVAALMAQLKGREGLTGVDYAEGFCDLHTPVLDYVERRRKGRWVSVKQPTDYEHLTLWPAPDAGRRNIQEENSDESQ